MKKFPKEVYHISEGKVVKVKIAGVVFQGANCGYNKDISEIYFTFKDAKEALKDQINKDG